jgi:hypothetical protein
MIGVYVSYEISPKRNGETEIYFAEILAKFHQKEIVMRQNFDEVSPKQNFASTKFR